MDFTQIANSENIFLSPRAPVSFLSFIFSRPARHYIKLCNGALERKTTEKTKRIRWKANYFILRIQIIFSSVCFPRVVLEACWYFEDTRQPADRWMGLLTVTCLGFLSSSDGATSRHYKNFTFLSSKRGGLYNQQTSRYEIFSKKTDISLR